jgi:hypothetical protein
MGFSLGATLAVLQLAFALTWVVYVIYLPALATQAGIPKQYVPWILLMDQAIFLVCDWLAGIYADRLAAKVGRIGPSLARITLLSCAAFIALPFLVPAGASSLFILLTVVWSATSSVLRAPPLVLMGRYATTSQQPWLAGLYLFGLGAAGAVAPYLGLQLKGVDPRIPFAVSSIVVAAVTFVLARVDIEEPAATPEPARSRSVPASVFAFAVAIVLLAVGFQIHFAVNSAPAFVRNGGGPYIEHLMPVFWIGFNFLMLPATLLAKRFDSVVIMLFSSLVGTVAVYVAGTATGLETLVAAQFVAGGAWGTALMGAFTAALAIGRTGREGQVMGMLFSVLALAAFARIYFATMVAPTQPQLTPSLWLVPVVAWSLATLVLAALAAGPGRRARPAAR